MCKSGNGGLAGKMQQDGRILADRVHQHRLAELRGGLAEDVDRLGFQQVEMGNASRHDAAPFTGSRVAGWACWGRLCRPHSLPSSFSHHQRPARMS
jgi:hypothetical protein